MKKILALILVLLMCISVTACKDSDGGKDDDDEITCSSCGEENSEDDLYCEDCGAKLNNHTNPIPTPQECKTCDSKGKIECKECDGRGYFPTEYGYRMLCSACWEGYSDCPDCEEATQSNSDVLPLPDPTLSPIDPYPTNCVRCNNSGKITCPSCNGAGGWDETKYSSDYIGNGGTPYTVHQTCRTCGGNKIIDCPNCY